MFFRLDDKTKIEKKCVIIIDDIVTSGSTLFTAYSILQNNGATIVKLMALTKSISKLK